MTVFKRVEVYFIILAVSLFIYTSSETKKKIPVLTIKAFQFNTNQEIIELKGIITTGTAKLFTSKVLRSDKKYIHVYIDSPGGSVLALDKMLDTMKDSGKKFKCVAKTAYSAAYMLFEMCDDRYILNSGTLMAHEASMVTSGTIKQIKKSVIVLEQILLRIETAVAKKMGFKHSVYSRMIAYDLWMTARDASVIGAVDGVIDRVFCSKTLIDAEEDFTIYTMGVFGVATSVITKSKCPLID